MSESQEGQAQEVLTKADTLKAYIAGLDGDRGKIAAAIAKVLGNGNSIRIKDPANPVLVAEAPNVLNGFANVLGEPLVLKRTGMPDQVFKPTMDGVAEADVIISRGIRTTTPHNEPDEFLNDDGKALGVTETKPMPVVTDRTPVERSGEQEDKPADEFVDRDTRYDARKDEKIKKKKVTGDVHDISAALVAAHEAETKRRNAERAANPPKKVGLLGRLIGRKDK